MIHPTIETLRRLRLTGMAKALEEQQGLSDCELMRIMVCKYLVMGCPPVSVFMAARQTSRGAVIGMVRMAARIIQIG